LTALGGAPRCYTAPMSTAESARGPGPSPPKRSRARRLLARVATLLASLLFCALVVEGAFRVLSERELAKSYHHGVGGVFEREPRWGWRPTRGEFEIGSSEFVMKGSVNALFMNDVPPDPEADRARTRVLALGDSHTYAVGASMEETWPKVLERELDAQSPGHEFRTYNAGMVGYNLHQYLLRLIDQGPIVKPHYVLVGLAYATDLYDLTPPDRGGWAYGWPDQPRDYFDFDGSGALTERHWTPPAPGAGPSADDRETASTRARRLLSNFATFRYLWRSNLALRAGANLRLDGRSLWPNMDVIVSEHLDEQQQYQWRLAEALIVRLKQESDRQGARMVLVGIPYLPQVYDEIWQMTFAGKPGYSPTIAIERMRAFCQQNGIDYVDTRDAIRERVGSAGHWLHYRKDAHPTPEGHAVIAHTIAQAGLIKPVDP
jgi:lysophospholipase L1-like esterase